MTQVRTAFFTMDFNAPHAVTGVLGGFDGVSGDRFEKTGPTGTGLEFSAGIEQRFTATDTGILTVVMAIPVFTTEGAFGAVLPRHPILFFVELLLPLGVGFVEFVGHNVCSPFRP